MTPPTPTAVLLSPHLSAVRAARRAGARSLVLAPDLAAPGVRQAAAAADRAVETDWSDLPRLLSVAGTIRPASEPASVFGFTEAGALAAARANEALRLPGNPHAAVAYLTDKAALRDRVNQVTDAAVRFERCDRAAALPAVAERVGYPCVAKPRTGFGGQAVHTLRSAAEASALARRLPPEPALIVEEYLDGPEYAVIALSAGGTHTVLTVCRVRTTGVPRHAETGQELPAELDPPVTARLTGLVEATLTAAGHHTGPSRTEVIITARGPRLIESHAHPGGEHVTELLRTATGIDLPARTIAAVLGLPQPPEPPVRGRCAGIRHLHLTAAELDTVLGVDDARALPGVTRVELTAPHGRHVPATTSRVAGHGYITATADSPEELDAVLRKAQETLRTAVTLPKEPEPSAA